MREVILAVLRRLLTPRRQGGVLPDDHLLHDGINTTPRGPQRQHEPWQGDIQCVVLARECIPFASTPDEFNDERIELLQAGRHTYPNMTPSYPHPHERDIRQARENYENVRQAKLNHYGYDACLQHHYLKGGAHPHDFNLPIYQWDATPD